MMEHLSEEQLYDHVDGVTGAAQDEVLSHLAGCAACRNAAAVHRQIRRQVSRVETGTLSKNFTTRIMREIELPHTAPRFSWLAQNSAHVVAMVFVVSVIGSIIYIAAQSGPAAGDSIYAGQFALLRDAYASLTGSIAAHNNAPLMPVVSETKDIFNGVFWTGIGALLLLGSLDKIRGLTTIFKAR